MAPVGASPSPRAAMRGAGAIALRTAVVLLAGAGTGLALNAVRPDALEPSAFAPATTCGPGDAPAIRVLSAGHAAHLCGRPEVLVADVRPAGRFAEGHVAGAIHLPCASSGDVLGRALDRAHDKRTIVVYGEATGDAEAVATALRGRLPRPDLEIVVLDGGFSAWNAAGQACSSGPCPECGVQAQDGEGKRQTDHAGDRGAHP